jgi:glyoxylase-like metal-dependent hydrolase (beta-lactamase superfamily II)
MKLHPIECGNFKLDGGAMFGVVPKMLWQKTNPADKNNLVEVSSRSLLVETGNRLVLIDAGMGNKQSKKFFSYYNRWGDFSLEKSLKEKGFHGDEITDVFLTHLHFDHCGGAIIKNPKGNLIPAFKNATYWSHKKHWEWANNPNSREKASFLSENIRPIKESGQLTLLEGDEFIMENSPLGFDVIVVNGHTEKQMLPLISYKNRTIVFTADLIPTVGHLPLAYVMGYDTRPLISLEEKNRFLKLAYEKKFLLFMEHDPFHELIDLRQTEKGVRMNQNHTLKSFFE